MRKVTLIMFSVMLAFGPNLAEAAKRHSVAGKRVPVAPTGAQYERQRALATQICRKKYGGQYTGFVITAQWMSRSGQTGWFCT